MPLNIHAVYSRDLLRLLPILLIAALMRVGDLSQTTNFAYDQGTLAILALDIATGHNFPLIGVESSGGIPHSPMSAYLLAPAYVFTDNPQVVSFAIGIFNLFGVALLWLIAHRYFNPTVALIAALAYALHPYAIHYSRGIWTPNYHTPIILLGLLFSLMGFIEKRRWMQVFALPTLILGMQVHYAAWTLLPVYTWIVFAGRKNIFWPALFASVVLGIISITPFAIGLSRLETGAVGSRLGESLTSLIARDKVLLYAARLITGLGAPWANMEFIGEYDVVFEIPSLLHASWLIIGLLTLIGLITAWKWGHFWAIVLWLWVVLPFAVFLPNWSGVYTHYFIPTIPMLSLLAAIGLEGLIRRIASPVRIGILAVFGLILLSQGQQYLEYLRVANERSSPSYPTPPVHYLLNVRDQISPAEDVIVSGGTSTESGYFIWKGLMYKRAECVRELVIADGGIAVFPSRPFAVIEPPNAPPAPVGDLYHSGETITVPLRPNEGAYTIYRFETPPPWNGPTLEEIAPIAFDNGVQLTGYRLDSGQVYLQWTLTRALERDYQYFAHFLREDGERIGQRDASFYTARYGCPEDRLITWVETEIPADITVLRVGMYHLEGERFINSNVFDGAGNPAGLWADIALE